MAAEVALHIPPGSSIDLSQFRREQARAVSAGQLARMHAVDAAVARAKAALAALDEARALRELAQAESSLLQTLSLPGAALFYAEIELQLGVCAAQLGQEGLASAAFARAALVDPSRRLLAGEAAPDIVALAERAFESAAAAPEGEVRVAADAPGAQLFVDDVQLGALPRVVRARAGMHVLRVEAAGFAPYARLFEVIEGVRPEQRVALSELAASRAVADIERAWAADPNAVVESLGAATRELFALAPELEGVALSERAASGQRSVFVSCSRAGCRAPVLAPPADALAASVRWRAEEPLSPASLQAARAWLVSDSNAVLRAHSPSHVAASDRDRGEGGSTWRWIGWSAATAAVIGAAIAIGVAAWPAPVHTQRLTVDPSGLR